MKGDRHNRPGPDGRFREKYIGREGQTGVLENARWRSEDGRVHQASRHHNRTLCEMGSNMFIDTLHERIVEFTRDRVDCVECIGYVTWHEYPID